MAGRVIFSSVMLSSAGEQYKVELFSEKYVGIDANIIGGSGTTFHVANDWTDFLQNGQELVIQGAASVSDSIVSFSYNNVQNRTEITVTTQTYGSQTRIYNDVTGLASLTPIFYPEIIDINTEWENESDELLKSIKASQTDLVYANNDEWFDRFMEMHLQGTDDDMKLVIYKDNSGYELEWVGNIVPDLWEYDNAPKPRAMTVRAIDGINRLKKIPYSEVTVNTNEVALKTHIKQILDKNELAQFFGLSDAYLRESIEYKNLDVTSVDDTDSPLSYTFFPNVIFLSEDIDDEGMSCYDALKSLLDLFSSRIFISKGIYYIQQVRNYDRNIVYRQFTKSMTTYTTDSYTSALTAGGNDRAEDLVAMAGGKFGYKAGLFRAMMEVNRNTQFAALKLGDENIKADANAGYVKRFEGTFEISTAGVNTDFFSLKFRPKLSTFHSYVSFIQTRITFSLVSGSTTYYYIGGLGRKSEWVTVPYSDLFYYVPSNMYNQLLTFEEVITEPFPSDGTLTVIIDFEFVTSQPNSIVKAYILDCTLMFPQSATDTLFADNVNDGYTTELELDPLIITDFSNNTSLNILKVDENYNTGTASLTPTTVWDADMDTDDYLSATRVAEAVSVQYRPLSKYMGKFEGQYYPHFVIGYDNKRYFMNGFRKNYLMDENDGVWIEAISDRSGIGTGEGRDEYDEKDIGMGSDMMTSMSNLNENKHDIGTLDTGVAEGATVTSLSIPSNGFGGLKSGDTIVIVNPVTNNIIDEYELDSDIGSSDTSISVVSKTAAASLQEGMVIQLKKEDFFSKLNNDNITDRVYNYNTGDEKRDLGLGSHHDYPTGGENTLNINVTDVNATITGIQPNSYVDGERIVVCNVGTHNQFFLNYEDANSTAANRITGSTGTVQINKGTYIELIYSTYLDRWTIPL